MVCLAVPWMGSIVEDSPERFRSFLISFWHEMRVDLEGRARVSMTQSSGDSTAWPDRATPDRARPVPFPTDVSRRRSSSATMAANTLDAARLLPRTVRSTEILRPVAAGGDPRVQDAD
jgi:hypothetical protein